MTRIIVSMTTTPARLLRLEPVIASIIEAQTMPVSVLVLNLPKTFMHFGSVTAVPAYLTQHPRIVVNRACADMGPATKITGLYSSAVKLLSSDVVVYVDDDHVLPKELVAAHVLAHQLCSQTVFGGRGGVFTDTDRTVHTWPFFKPVHTVDGVGTVSFCAKDVDGAALMAAVTRVQASPAARASDDVVLSCFFQAQGLHLRLVPCQTQTTPLPFAYGEDALSKGQFGSVDGNTTQRYKDVAAELKLTWPLLDQGPLFNLASTKCPIPTPTDTAFVLFAFNRPYYLERVLQSLKTCHGFDAKHLHVFLDGPVHLKTGKLNSRVVRYTENMAMLNKYFPDAYVFRAGVNYGVGVMQHHAMSMVFQTYQTAVFLEDDLILGTHYIRTLQTLKDAMDRLPNVNAVQGGYRTEEIDDNKVLMLDARKKHCHYWGWLTTRDRFERMAPWYHAAAAELFDGVDYMTRDLTKYRAWFQRHGLSDDHCSQDWVRDGCYRLAGMPYKLVCAQRRAAPIGQHGLHSTPEIFKKLNLDPKTTDIDHGPPVAMTIQHPYTLAVLHTPCPVRTYLGRFRGLPSEPVLPFTVKPNGYDVVVASAACLRVLAKKVQVVDEYREDFYYQVAFSF